MYYGYYGMDATYLLVVIGLLITLIAQAKVKTAYAKYQEVRSLSGLTGAQAARKILVSNGIYDVDVECLPTKGLTDYYDPQSKRVCLSIDIYNGTSIAALAIAAHECGHALQDALEYTPLRLRTALVPVANIGSKASWYFILAGLMIGGQGAALCEIGIVMFALAVGLELVTLPVEFHASRRALSQVEELGLVTEEEQTGAQKVLNAAALTYVAAAASGLLQLLRLVILFGNRRGRRD